MNSYCQESLHRWYDDFTLYPMTYIKSRSITCIRVHHCLYCDNDILISSSISYSILSGMLFPAPILFTAFKIYAITITITTPATIASCNDRNRTTHVNVWILLNSIFGKWFCIDPRSVTISILGLWMLFTLSKEMNTASLLSNWYIVLIVSTFSWNWQ